MAGAAPPGETPARLAALRALMRQQGVDALLVPRSDRFLGEYVPPDAERLAWLTGFSGSAGLAVILEDRAALFTDGRYLTQASQQVDTSLFSLAHMVATPPQAWLADAAPGARLGYDPWLHTEAFIARFADTAQPVPLDRNLIDAIWPDRPPPPDALLEIHPAGFAGQAATDKRDALAGELRAASQAACILADPHSVAWLLNIRGADLPHTPIILAQAIAHADGRVDLFVEEPRVDAAARDHLGAGVALQPPGQLAAALASLAGKVVRLDPDSTPAWFGEQLKQAQAKPVFAADPCRMPRARKNRTEQAGARAAHLRDGLAMARFLSWFAAEAPRGRLTEMRAAAALLSFREGGEHFRGESFPAISAAGPDGAVIHFRPSASRDRPIRPNEVYLIDSGAQYRDGTTDITRTLWSGPDAPPAEVAGLYTRVLRGHLALSAARFPAGVCGPHLDALARGPLWEVGLDYDHGTGHGVGSFLSVHEAPPGISRTSPMIPLAEGMIVSNEPGYYAAGEFGIRIENLLMVQPTHPAPVKPFLAFETLTLAPYDRSLIRTDMLQAAEIAAIDAYHQHVLATLAPHLPPDTRAWLTGSCQPLGAG
jgi:Xaa-Pro aminopeptidase